MWDFLDDIGPTRDDDISQGMHHNVCLKSQLKGFLLDRGQPGMVDGNLQCNLRARFGLEIPTVYLGGPFPYQNSCGGCNVGLVMFRFTQCLVSKGNRLVVLK